LQVLIAPPLVEHAFVLKDSEWMAQQVIQKLKEEARDLGIEGNLRGE
jgi:hypothetical protein